MFSKLYNSFEKKSVISISKSYLGENLGNPHSKAVVRLGMLLIIAVAFFCFASSSKGLAHQEAKVGGFPTPAGYIDSVRGIILDVTPSPVNVDRLSSWLDSPTLSRTPTVTSTRTRTPTPKLPINCRRYLPLVIVYRSGPFPTPTLPFYPVPPTETRSASTPIDTISGTQSYLPLVQ